MNRKQPIRTYQRKKTQKLAMNAPLSSLSVILATKSNFADTKHDLSNNGVSDNSIILDPFETTFDRIAKDAIIPPLPLDTNQNDSWYNSSSDSNVNDSNNDINNATNTKSPEYFNMAASMHKNADSIRTYKRLQKNESQSVVSMGILSKKAKITLIKEIQPKIKTQVQKKRKKNKTQKMKVTQYESEKSSYTYNKISQSTAINNLEDVKENCISRNHNKHLQSISKIKKDAIAISSQVVSNQISGNITTVQTDCYQNKPCFVKLNTHSVQDWYMNHSKTKENKQENVSHDTKLSCTNILHTNKNISKIPDTVSQSVDCDIIENLKHMSIKPCFVVLHDNIVKDWVLSKNKKNTTDFPNEQNMSHLTSLNLAEISSNRNTSSNTVTSDIKEDRTLLKDSFVKIEKLDIQKLGKRKNTVFNGKEKNMISSTPIGKHIRPSTYSVSLSPINTNTCDTLYSKYCESNTADIQEQQTQIILSQEKPDTQEQQTQIIVSQKLNIHEQLTQVIMSQEQTAISNFEVKTETIYLNEDTHTSLVSDCNIEYDAKLRFPCSLDISAGTDQSRSLFDDTTCNSNHLKNNAIGNNKTNEYLTNVLESTKINTSSYLLTDLSTKEQEEKKEFLSNNTYFNGNWEDVSFSELPTTREDLDNINIDNINIDNIVHIKQECKSQEQDTEMDTEIDENEIANDSKCNFLSSQDNSDNIDTVLTQLEDPIRITKRRVLYPKWQLSTSNISENLTNISILANNKILDRTAIDEHTNIVSTTNNFESYKNITNSSSKLLNDTIQHKDKDMPIRKSVFLKPGKCWARSLSILNNIHTESNLDELSVGKGKRWRHSVRNILHMQKQGIFQSCLNNIENNTDPAHGEFNISNISPDNNICKVFDATNYIRFSKRISVRVVPNNTSIKCDVEDISFFEAFGIAVENSSLKLKTLHWKESCDVQHDSDRSNSISRSNSITAKDVVLQRCSQKHYLPFSECFPDSYLEHCYKIGEGVYGEVFLYKHDDKTSVIKIIPIEGEELINGERQKKFNEILSEIVIAKELHNLRSHTTFRTDGFIEVKSIRCIIGKYPEKLIELWNIYDNDKASDNDCPSIFNENQLYIALELTHGGQDLEAFVFHTAEKAYSLFVQITLTLAVAEKALEFEHRDLHWGNVLISKTKEPHICYNLDGKEIKFPSNGIKVSIIDFTLSRMSYQKCCIYNDLALDPALFTAHGEYQFEIYRLMRDKIGNNWRNFEPYTNILWLHYILDKMITAVRYKRKNLKTHKNAIVKLKEFKDTILNYDSAFDFVSNSRFFVNNGACLLKSENIIA